MNELIRIDKLKDHPQNTYYFDDVTGGKWDELLASIKSSGIYEKIIITPDKTIVSGHQRVRACKELGIQEIKYEMLDFENEDEVVKCLIETNTKQRGTVADSDLKQGRRYLELERIYGIKNGGDRKSDCHCDKLITQEELAKKSDISVSTWNRKKSLTNLIPEFQKLMLNKKLTTKVALIYSAMPPEEQFEIYNEIGKDKISSMNYEQTKFELDNVKKQNQRLQQELHHEKSKPAKVETRIEYKDRVVEKVIDKTDYTTLSKLKQIEQIKLDLENKNRNLESTLKMKEQLLENYKVDSEEYRKLKLQMSKLQVEKDDVSHKTVSVLKLTELASDIELFLYNKLAPTKYKDFMDVLNYDDTVRENFIHTIELVGDWYREMKNYASQNNYENIITVEVN